MLTQIEPGDVVVELVRPHQGQKRILAGSSRFNVVNCGRRFGKTTLGIDRATNDGALAYPVGWFSPTYKMLLEVWREASQTLAPIIARRNVQERRLENIAGGVLEFWSLDNPDAARGRKYKRVIIDEAAMVPDLMDAWQHVIRASLADYAGDAWMLSTPKGHNGFWQMYQWGLDDQMPDWACWTMPTSSNPYIADSEIEAMRATMPETIYRQEILAEFIADAGGVFRGVADCATAPPYDTAQDGRQYVMGVDWGRSNDFTVFTVVDVQAKALVYLDRFTQIDYEIQTSRLRNVISRFNPTVAVVEYNSMGGPIVERLQSEGLPVQSFTTTSKTKEVLIRGLESAFDHREISILNDPILIGELQAYEQQKTATGWKFSAPDGMHDDTVMSLALAWHGISSYRPAFL